MEADPLDTDAIDARAAERASKARAQSNSETDDWRWLMGQKRGRRIVWRQLERAGVFRSPFNTNAMQMAHSCGEKNEGLRLLAYVMTACPERYIDMAAENRKQPEIEQ